MTVLKVACNEAGGADFSLRCERVLLRQMHRLAHLFHRIRGARPGFLRAGLQRLINLRRILFQFGTSGADGTQGRVEIIRQLHLAIDTAQCAGTAVREDLGLVDGVVDFV